MLKYNENTSLYSSAYEGKINSYQCILSRGINFRDFSGIKTIENRYIKAGKIIRSGAHHQFENDDKNFLSQLAIDTIIDLRATKEREHEKTNLSLFQRSESTKITHIAWDYELHFDVKKLMDEIEKNPELIDEKIDELYLNFYEELPLNFGTRLIDLINQLKLGSTILFHCSAGKDRTGFVAFLILSILEVDNKTIYQNYLESNLKKNRRKLSLPDTHQLSMSLEEVQSESMNPVSKIPTEVAEQLMQVKSIYLKAAEDIIITNYGSVINYVAHFTALTHKEIDDIKNHYLI